MSAVIIDRAAYFAAKRVENDTARLREIVAKLEIRTGDKRQSIKNLLDTIERDVQLPADCEWSHAR